MSLTASVNVPFKASDAVEYVPVSGTAIYTGALVELTAAGLLQPWTNGATNSFAGVALEGTIVPLAENSQGGVAPFTGIMSPNKRGINVGRSGRLYRFPFSGAAVTNLGNPIYATDDHTITITPQTQRIGTCVDYESGYLWVDFSGFAIPPVTPSSFPVDLSAATGTGVSLAENVGSTGTPVAISTANQQGISEYYTTALTTGTTYGHYIMLTSIGVGVEAIAARSWTYLSTAAAANAHGYHATLELDTSAGNVTGLGTGLRGNVVIPNRAVAAGTYFGVYAELYANGNTAALPAGSNACLGINSQPGTAMDLVANAISFTGTDATGAMIYSAGEAAPAIVGSIRILVNGAIRYLYYGSAQA